MIIIAIINSYNFISVIGDNTPTKWIGMGTYAVLPVNNALALSCYINLRDIHCKIEGSSTGVLFSALEN